MCVAMNGTILNPAISPKIKIWTAAIIINFIVKHHVLRTYQCRVFHENSKDYQYVCFPNDSRYKVIKNVSIKLVDDEIIKRWKTIPVAILFVNISLARVTSSTVMSSKLSVEIPRNGNIIYVTKYEWKGFRNSNIILKIPKINAVWIISVGVYCLLY